MRERSLLKGGSPWARLFAVLSLCASLTILAILPGARTGAVTGSLPAAPTAMTFAGYSYDHPAGFVAEANDAVGSQLGSRTDSVRVAGGNAGVERGPRTLLGGVVAANAGTRSIDDLLRPGGLTIGKAGTDDTIREITGGLPEAQTMFQQLSQGGSIVAQTPKLTRVELPNGGGFVQLRTVMSPKSPNTVATIDVNIPGFDIAKLKYNP